MSHILSYIGQELSYSLFEGGWGKAFEYILLALPPTPTHEHHTNTNMLPGLE